MSMSALSAYDLADLQATETTWHIPAALGAIAGGLAMHFYMERGPRASGMLSGLSGYRSRRRRGSRGARCTRFKRTRAGRRCARYA